MIDGGGSYGIISESPMIIGTTGEVHITSTFGVLLEILVNGIFDCWGILNIED